MNFNELDRGVGFSIRVIIVTLAVISGLIITVVATTIPIIALMSIQFAFASGTLNCPILVGLGWAASTVFMFFGMVSTFLK